MWENGVLEDSSWTAAALPRRAPWPREPSASTAATSDARMGVSENKGYPILGSFRIRILLLRVLD